MSGDKKDIDLACVASNVSVHEVSHLHSAIPNPHSAIGNLQSAICNPLEGHELWSEVYDHLPNPLLHLEERELAAALPDVRGLSVADLACGTGRWLQRLAARGPRIWLGVDFSPAMLRCAASKTGLVGCLIQARIESLPIQSESLDLLVCSFALGYLETLTGFVAEAQRLLKPGGQLIVTDLHPGVERLGWKRSFRCGPGIVEIESRLHPVGDTTCALRRGFQSVRTNSWFLGEPERPLFENAGKLAMYEQAMKTPAVIFFACRKV